MADTLENSTDLNAAAPRPKPSIDRVGNYRIIDEIGAGGMAVVYKGVQESLGRTVAIKALKTVLTGDTSIVARFEREALSVASFRHENIITLYDFFKERGALFMVMEYVEGIDLYDLLEKAQTIPSDVAAIMALHIARALEYAHFRGVIHRDVKPANVIVSRLGEVKLTDFGIARTEHSDLTEAGIGLGTPAYMSPEQVIGDRLDHRSDIWSLGVVTYQLITGRKPFADAEDRSVMQRIRLEQPIAPREIAESCPRDLERIVLQCMEKRPDDRFNSTQQLVIALEQYLATNVPSNYRARLVLFLKDQGVISNDETTAMLHPALIGNYDQQGRPQRPRRQRRRSLLGLVGVGLLGTAVGVGAGFWGGQRPSQQPDPEVRPPLVCPEQNGKPTGHLYVRAQPWANVEVDGKHVETTPFARPLVLAVGAHKVVLASPYMKRVVKKIIIRANEATLISHPETEGVPK
ncbi:MAG: serine/threonine protein kinase [Deltaproteobacteria bacterium]|nr:serine/threonine protein kinase [Deltaproteobacteria bacterium]